MILMLLTSNTWAPWGMMMNSILAPTEAPPRPSLGHRREAMRLLAEHPNVALAKYAEQNQIHARNLCIDDVDGGEVVIGGRRHLNFCSNDYLGLRHHPKVVEAAKAAIDRFGAGLGSSRLMSGNIPLHYELEHQIADWLGWPAAMLVTTGYQANLGLLSALLSSDGEMIADAGVHASAIDGARMAGASLRSFRRGSITGLSAHLARPSNARCRLVMMDSVYSMDGGLCDVDTIARSLETRDDVLLVVDEAHSLGVFGPDGAGQVAGSELGNRVDFVTGTLSKSLGSVGGFIAGDAETLEALAVQCRPMMFSTASSPGALGAALASLQLIRGDQEGRRAHVMALSQRLRDGLRAVGADTWKSESQIVPVVLGRPEAAGMAYRAMGEAGICCGLSIWPAVPAGRAMLRFSVNADLSENDIDRAIDAVARVLPSLSDPRDL
jgi:8-amino-7-oxononanoate synthase